jgi:hypothetical protein
MADSAERGRLSVAGERGPSDFQRAWPVFSSRPRKRCAARAVKCASASAIVSVSNSCTHRSKQHAPLIQVVRARMVPAGSSALDHEPRGVQRRQVDLSLVFSTALPEYQGKQVAYDRGRRDHA